MSNNSPINLDKRAKRTREISIRVNDYELLELKKRNRGSTVASWLRDLALGVTPVKPVDPELVRQLGRIGSNLNQLTRHVNTERQVDTQVLHEIKAIREQMHLLIESFWHRQIGRRECLPFWHGNLVRKTGDSAPSYS